MDREREKTHSEELDEGRLSGSVGSEDTDSRREGKGARDVVELRPRCTGVGERAVGELHDRPRVGSDTHERSGRGELEGDRGGGEGVVRLGLGDPLDELRKVALVVGNLLVLVVHDVGARVVEETGVVRDHDAGDLGLRDKVSLQPRDGTDICKGAK